MAEFVYQFPISNALRNRIDEAVAKIHGLPPEERIAALTAGCLVLAERCDRLQTALVATVTALAHGKGDRWIAERVAKILDEGVAG